MATTYQIGPTRQWTTRWSNARTALFPSVIPVTMIAAAAGPNSANNANAKKLPASKTRPPDKAKASRKKAISECCLISLASQFISVFPSVTKAVATNWRGITMSTNLDRVLRKLVLSFAEVFAPQRLR
jgi:hypothetical protein